MRNWLAVAALLLSGVSSHAATYKYTAPTYTTFSAFAAPCAIPICANFAPGTHLQGSFATAAALPANLPFTEITPLVTGFSFSDGLTTYSSADPLVRLYNIYATTDATGAIATFALHLDRWQAVAPHAPGSRYDGIDLSGAGAIALHNALCLGVAASPVNATPDVCTSNWTDANTSHAGEAVASLPVLGPPPSFRTYLSPNGVDTNPCTLAAPCRLLPAALAAVIDGGEIWMLASANYNTAPVNVDKSVTILAVPGALGSVVAPAVGGSAFNIATGGVKLSLRNLVIVPFVGGGDTGGVHTGGIEMTAGASLSVENCLIANLPGNGISVSASGASVLVTDTTIRGNNGHGLFISDGVHATVTRTTISGNGGSGVAAHGNLGGTLTTADVADSTLNANEFGIIALSNNAGAVVKVSVRNSQVVLNSTVGVFVESNSGESVNLSAINSVISNNTIGVQAASPGARVWASGNTVSDNGTGLSNASGALFQSAGDNAVRNNGVDASGVISPAPAM